LNYLSTDAVFTRLHDLYKSKCRVADVQQVSQEDFVPDHNNNDHNKPDIKSGYWFRCAHFAMTYPWPVLAVLFGLLSGLIWVVVTKAKFGNGGLSLLPLGSELRQNFDDISASIPTGNKNNT
jgi:uncharacterized membrane protein YdfJ with MMPL/SSD domain